MRLFILSYALLICLSVSSYSQEDSRIIVGASQDENGYIVSVCNPNESWFIRSLEQTVTDIENGIKYLTYCSADDRKGEVIIKKIGEDGTKRKTITTTGDGSTCNNLDKLPDCSLLLTNQGES